METHKIKINIVSGTAGTGSAEHAALIRDNLSNHYDVVTDSRDTSDIVHYYTIDPASFADIIKKGVKHSGGSVCTVLLTPKTAERRNDLPAPLKWILTRYMMHFYKSVDVLTVNNPLFITELLHGGIPREKIHYIPIPVITELFHEFTPHEKLTLRDKFGIGGGEFVVVGAGQLTPQCALPDFVETARLCPNMSFVCAGDYSASGDIFPDADITEIKKVVDSAPTNVKFIGAVSRDSIHEIWGIADVCFLPDHDERFPYAAVSAMCERVPLLLRDLPFYSDVLFDCYRGESSLDGFVQQLTRMKNDPVYYTHGVDLAAEGSKFYKKDKIVKMWDELYFDIF